jgi:hypothetical protein
VNLDPRLQPLIDVLVDLCVRDLEMETPSSLGKESDGVGADRDAENTTIDAPAR